MPASVDVDIVLSSSSIVKILCFLLSIYISPVWVLIPNSRASSLLTAFGSTQFLDCL